MIHNTGSVKEGFRPHKYQGRKSTKGKINCNWRGDPVGKGLLVLVGLIGDSNGSQTVDILRDFSAQGASPSMIYTRLTKICPWVNDWYMSKTGNLLTEKIVWNRYHKMYYDNNAPRGSRGRISDEHYKRDARLRPHIERILLLFQTGKPITFEQMKGATS